MGKTFADLELPVDKPGRMTILDPATGISLKRADGSEAYLDLFSQDSPAGVAYSRDLRKRALKRNGRKLTTEEIEAELIEQTVALCAGWSLATRDGRDLDVPFTKDVAREFFENPALAWVRRQADTFTSEIANFVPASSAS